MQPVHRTKQVIWDPTGTSDRFVVGGTNGELRMYQWEHAKSNSRLTTLSVVSELNQLRTFAWSPHENLRDLMAVGTSSGRTILLRLDAAASPSVVHQAEAGLSPKLSAASINVRQARPINVVAFCPAQPELLAVGLEKARGESLLLYDIEASIASLNSSSSSTPERRLPFGREASPSGINSSQHSSSSEPQPLVAFGSSETTSSAAFLYSSSASSSPILMASMGGKFLRAYDLRTPAQSIAHWGTRAIFTIRANPFNGHQCVSHGDDGLVRLWDIRTAGSPHPLLEFSDSDSGSLSGKAQVTAGQKALVDLAWNPSRRGEVAVLEKEGKTVRVWNVLDGPIVESSGTKGDGPTSGVEGSHSRNASVDDTPRPSTKRLPPLGSANGAEEEFRYPILHSDHLSQTFHQSLTSFTYVNSPSFTSSTTHLVGVSRESSLGSSGQRVEIIRHYQDECAALLEKELVVPSRSNREPFSAWPVGVPVSSTHEAENLVKKEPDDLDDDDEDPTPLGTSNTVNHSRGRTFSLLLERSKEVNASVSGSVTPRGGVSRVRVRPGDGKKPELPGREGLESLKWDQGAVMRERVEKGYGSSASLNALIAGEPLVEFWNWVSRAETLSQKDACLLDYDFRFRGVLSILLGFSSASSRPSTQQTAQHRSSNAHPGTIYSDIHRSLRRGDEARAKDAAYSAAVQALVGRRRLESVWVIGSSGFAPQRRVALQSCGKEYEEGDDAVCKRYAAAKNYESAAKHAFFGGYFEKATSYLRSCDDDNLRLLAPVLAAYVAQKGTAKGMDSVFAESCRSLSSDGDTPWIRAMFAYLASSDWRELVDETGLPLKDRVAVALRFLPDSELLAFLQELGTEALVSGDLEAVLLLGLRGDGLDLIRNYVDRTADVQSAAIACSFISPGILRDDRRVERWIHCYRGALNQMQLYAPRALFDSARGRRARETMDQARASGRQAEVAAVAAALRKAAPPQLLIRCQFCSSNITPRSQLGEVSVQSERAAIPVKSDVCPTCSKALPGCAVCLERPSIHSWISSGSTSLCWCQKCRHGGHVDHILEWFDRSEVCAVADCDCLCRG